MTRNIRIVDSKGYIAGEYYCEPGNERMRDRLLREFREIRRLEPDSGWKFETRGESADWHTWTCA